MNLLATNSTPRPPRLATSYTEEHHGFKNQELRDRILAGFVGVVLVALTLFYGVALIVWLWSGGKYPEAIEDLSLAIQSSLAEPEEAFIAFSFGLLVIGVSLFVLTVSNFPFRRMGELWQAQSITSVAKSFNAIMSIMFLVAFLAAVNGIFFDQAISAKGLITSLVGIVLSMILAALQGASVQNRLVAMAANNESRNALVKCRDSIKLEPENKFLRVSCIPVCISSIPLAIETLILFFLPLRSQWMFLSGVLGMFYAGIAICIAVQIEVTKWNQTRTANASRHIKRVQVISLWIIVISLPFMSIRWEVLRGHSLLVAAVVLTVLMLACSIVLPLVYMNKSVKFRVRTQQRQKCIIQRQIHAIDAWKERQKEWLEPINRGEGFDSFPE